VFTLFAIAFLSASTVAGIVALVMALALHGPEFINPTHPEHHDRLEAVFREPPVFLPMLLATQAVLLVAALSAAYLSPTPLRRRLRLGRPALPWYGYPVVCVGTLALGVTFGVLIELLGFGDHGVLKEFERAIAGMRGGLLVAAAAVIGLAPGFGEEFLFRGYIQTRLRQRWPRLLALVVTSLLFGLLHLDPVQSTMAVFLGLWLGEIADRTGSIWPAVIAHAFNNAAATVLSALLATTDGDATETWKTLLVTVPIFTLSLAYLVWRPVVEVEPDPSPAPAPVPPSFAPPAPPYYMPPPGVPGAS
jgi:hypothetical protein